MKRVTSIATAIVLAVLVGMSARVAAQNTVPSERTFMTFSNTVEMPGVTLPAGTYVFRLADTPTRNVVQVLSKDEKDMLGQWTFVQARRAKATEDTVVMFKEMPEGTTAAVQDRDYPGETIGKEFIYPKDQGQKIANRTGSSVLTDDGRVQSTVASTDSQGKVTNWVRETDGNKANAAVTPAPDTSRDSAALSADASQSRSRAVGTSGAGDVQATDRTRAESTQARASELPRTASPAPLAGLIGLMALAGALGTRRLAALRR